MILQSCQLCNDKQIQKHDEHINKSDHNNPVMIFMWLHKSSFHAFSHENKNKGKCANAYKTIVSFYQRDCDKIKVWKTLV